ncbi:MAG: hypothetical protein LBI54_05780 [Lachnospiraceae bacterium]|jgi:hypothetical protein|nr:hypothetical protein [Lachnospiraceae bacterium]
MRDNYDFSDAIKSPFAGKEKGKFTVTIHYDVEADNDEESTDGLPVIAEAENSYSFTGKTN